MEVPVARGKKSSVKQEFAYLRNGKVVATITWGAEDTPPIDTTIYAPNKRIAAQLPSGGTNFGQQVAQLIESGELVPFYKIARQLSGLYRIDDRRPGQGRSYMIWTGEGVLGRGPALQPRVVYHYMEEGTTPRLRSYSEVHALMKEPNVLRIDSLRGIDTSKTVTEGLGADGRVMVMNLQKLYKEYDER
jgi:hypothetical protein